MTGKNTSLISILCFLCAVVLFVVYILTQNVLFMTFGSAVMCLGALFLIVNKKK